MLHSISTENSVLFLGSGFSVEATNRLGKAPPTGGGFRTMLAKKIGDPTSDATLPDLAEVYAGDDPSALATLVNDVFRTTATSRNQDDIATAPWLRIYTTNFDDAVEFALSKARLKIRGYSFEDEKPRKLFRGTIVHLHGTVRDVDRANVISKLVLGESAYVRQHLERSHWYDQFLYDLKFADSCFLSVIAWLTSTLLRC